MDCGECGEPEGVLIHSVVLDAYDRQGKMTRELKFEDISFCTPECVLSFAASAAREGKLPQGTVRAEVSSMEFHGEEAADED